jgi:YCII-related domain
LAPTETSPLASVTCFLGPCIMPILSSRLYENGWPPDVLGPAWLQKQKGKLYMAGAIVEPLDGGLMIFKGASVEEIKAFIAADPYAQNGIVTESSVRPLAWVTPA